MYQLMLVSKTKNILQHVHSWQEKLQFSVWKMVIIYSLRKVTGVGKK